MIPDSDHVSPDGELRFLVRSPDGDITMGFDGFSWHTHGDILAALSSGTPEEAARRFVADLLSNRLIIALSKADGRVRDVWITDDPAEALRSCQGGETIAFRLWNGMPVGVDNGGPPEPEIIQLNVQRAGMEKITLEATLVDTIPDICRLVIAWPVGGDDRRFDAHDFYECLRAFRRVIEPEGFRVLCQGARPNVRPSGMSSEAGAWKSFVLTLGQPTSMKDLVGTFDPVDDLALVGTVEEQDEFFRRHWAEFEKRTSST